MVTTQCWAMPRMVLDQVGLFNDRIIRGWIPEMRHRVRQAGDRIICVPGVWSLPSHALHAEGTPAHGMAEWRGIRLRSSPLPETVPTTPRATLASSRAVPLAYRVLRHSRLGTRTWSPPLAWLAHRTIYGIAALFPRR